MVQVQKQAQEQELFLPVKWVWVKCISGQPGASKKKMAGFVQAGIWQLSLDFHIFSFPSFLSHPVPAPQFFINNSRLLMTWVSKNTHYWNPAGILHLDSMVFAATGWF